jgi:uncharacterized protein
MKKKRLIPITPKKPPALTGPRERFRQMLVRIRQLDGNPHYISMGMAVGIFVSILPIIPLQTVVAVSLAFLARGSKSAAALGTWLSNPLTIPLVYYANYKLGCTLLGYQNTVDHIAFNSFSQLMALGIEVTRAMVLGGVVIGAVLGVAAYFITLRLYRSFRNRSRPTDIPPGPAS